MKRHLRARRRAGFIRLSSALACAAACCTVFLCLSCASPAADAEAQQKKDRAEAVEIPSGNFAANWRAQLPGRQIQPKTIYVNDDKVLVYTEDNKCIWLNRASGHIVSITQAAKTTDTLYPPCTLTDRVVFPGTSEVSVFDRNGKLMHRIPLRYNASSGASGDGRTIYFGADHPNGGRVVAMDTRAQPYDVSPAWELQTRGQVSATPANYQGLVFTGSRDGGVYAVRGENRDNIWPGLPVGYFQTGGDILANLEVDKDGVYVSSMDSKLYCLDVNTGRVRWTYYAGRPLRQDSSPIATTNFVYLYVPQAGIVAIDKTGKMETRTPKWAFSKGRQFLSSDEKYAYIRTDDNAVVAVDKQTGAPRFQTKRNDFRFFATNTSAKDTSIYACTPTGMVYSIKAVLKPGTIGEWVMAPGGTQSRDLVLVSAEH